MNDRGAIVTLDLLDGRIADIVPLIPGTAQLAIGPGGQDEDGGYNLIYVYETPLEAFSALVLWIDSGLEGEPDGWFRDPITGRRRPQGDPTQEFIRM